MCAEFLYEEGIQICEKYLVDNTTPTNVELMTQLIENYPQLKNLTLKCEIISKFQNRGNMFSEEQLLHILSINSKDARVICSTELEENRLLGLDSLNEKCLVQVYQKESKRIIESRSHHYNSVLEITDPNHLLWLMEIVSKYAPTQLYCIHQDFIDYDSCSGSIPIFEKMVECTTNVLQILPLSKFLEPLQSFLSLHYTKGYVTKLALETLFTVCSQKKIFGSLQ